MSENFYSGKSGGEIVRILGKHLAHWPLFLSLVLVSLVAAWFYNRSVSPVYEASASLLIADGSSGSPDTRLLESFNIAPSDKSLQNEIEIIRSKTLMKEVVRELCLYAPVLEDAPKEDRSAYLSSPVIIEVRDPEHITSTGKVYFMYDDLRNSVRIDGMSFPLNTWSTTNYGLLRFKTNPSFRQDATFPLYFSLTSPYSIANNYVSRLSVLPLNRNSSIVSIRFRDEIAQRAKDILNTLSDAYARSAISVKNVMSNNSLRFLEDRIRYIENDLDSLELKIQLYKSQKGIIDLSSQGKMFLNNVSSNDQRIGDINMQLSILDQVEKYVQSKDGANGIVPSTFGLNEPMLNKLLDKLYSAQMQYEQSKNLSDINNPQMLAIKSEIDQLKPSLLENIANLRNNLTTGSRSLAALNNGFSSVLTRIPKQEKELLEFSRRQMIKSSVYTFLLQKREEAALTASSTIPNSRIIDPAEAALIPPSPGKAVVYTMAVFLGLFMSALIVTLKDVFNTKIIYRSEIESITPVPVVSEFVQLKKGQSLIVNNARFSLISEQFRQLRSATGLHEQTDVKMRILVSSGLSGEGKSFVSANLALSLALAGKKVVLVDLDLRKPGITAMFGLRAFPGISEYLVSNQQPMDFVRATKYDNLCVVPAGNEDVSPTELLLNGRLHSVLESLSERFDFTIIDTAPVDIVSDAYILSRYCDQTLFVVRQGFTPRSVVQVLQEGNKLATLKSVSIVFNSVRSGGFLAGLSGYRYGYGSQKFVSLS
jgi:tyrosine-protein kinase Etk/Wzc